MELIQYKNQNYQNWLMGFIATLMVLAQHPGVMAQGHFNNSGQWERVAPGVVSLQTYQVNENQQNQAEGEVQLQPDGGVTVIGTPPENWEGHPHNTDELQVHGDLYGQHFYGDGSGLTGVEPTLPSDLEISGRITANDVISGGAFSTEGAIEGGSLVVQNAVNAESFSGDGSDLHGVIAAGLPEDYDFTTTGDISTTGSIQTASLSTTGSINATTLTLSEDLRASGTISVGTLKSVNDLPISLTSNLMTEGFMGIGTNTADKGRLHVRGNLHIETQWADSEGNHASILHVVADEHANGNNDIHSNKGRVFVGSNAYQKYTDQWGGTMQNLNFRLWVSEGIVTEDIAIMSTGNWADHVFKEDYHLPDLLEVEDFIHTHGHLPNIPSQHAVQTDGYLIHEINRRYLEKIEELTLYTIQQEKLIREGQQAYENLLKRIEALEGNH